MITVHLNKNLKKSLYIQLYERIKEEIIYCRLKPDEALPSKRTFAEHLGVSVKTIENAYDQLLLEGYIYSIPQKGFFVQELTNYRVAKKQFKPFAAPAPERHYDIDIKYHKVDPELFPASTWFRLMRETLTDNYTDLLKPIPYNGEAELRVAISQYLYEFRGMHVSADQIIIGAGTEYLYGRLIQLLGKGVRYGIADPGAKHIKSIYDGYGADIRPLPLNENGRYSLNQADLYGCQVLHTDPSHQQPLGDVMTIQRRLEILEWVNAGKDRYIIEDDYASEFRFKEKQPPSLYSIDIREKVIYINTFSSTVVPSVRIGYMVLPRKLMSKYVESMSFYACTVPSVEQITLAKFIKRGQMERYINKIRRKNNQICDQLIAKLKACPVADRISFRQTHSGYSFQMHLDKKISDADMIELMKKKGILCTFVSDFCQFQNPYYDSIMLVHYASMDEAQMDYFVKQFSDAMIAEQEVLRWKKKD